MAMPLRKKRDSIMPPPGPPKTVIAIGIGPKKPGDGPQGDERPSGMPKGEDMPPEPLTPPSAGAAGAPGDEEDEGKASPEKAIVIRADNHCKDCKNYDTMTGDCSEVEGVFQPEDGCWSFFSGMHDEPDADEAGGAPDADADDAKMGAMGQ